MNKKPRKAKIELRKGKSDPSEKEIKLKFKEANNERIIFHIKDYLFLKDANKSPTYLEFAKRANLNWRTFKSKVNQFEKYGHISQHGNKGKAPHNKISASVVEKLLERFDKLLKSTREHHNMKELPLTLSTILFFLKKQYQTKGETFPVATSTFYLFFTKMHRWFISKNSDKSRRKLVKKILATKVKIKKMQEAHKEAALILAKKAYENQVLDTSYYTSNQYKPSPLREAGKEGNVLIWDGSADYYYNGMIVTRMQVIDQKSLFTMGISFVKHENNKGYKELLNCIFKFGLPAFIKCDKRKGVDPTDPGALIAIICRFLNITILADSNSNHKADLEKINGNMHPLVALYCAINKIKTIEELRKHTKQIADYANELLKYHRPDFSHLKQLTDIQKKFFNMELEQVKIMSENGIIYKKRAYAAIDSKGKEIIMPRFTWALIAISDGIPKLVHTDDGIFKLIQITKELKASTIMANLKSWGSIDKHFVNNGVMISNRETIWFLIKEARSQGFKDAERHKLWQLNEQANKLLDKKRKLSQDIEKLMSRLNNK